MFKKMLYGCVCLGLLTSATGYAATRYPTRVGASPGVTQSAVSASPRQAIYYYAKTGNLHALQQLRARGYPVDLKDSKGNTALCEAVWRQNRQAVKTLLTAGANRQAACLSRIPDKYLTPMDLTAPAPRTAAAGKAGATATGLSTGAKVGIGVGAVALIGGGIALAAGGGGGGGGGDSSATQTGDIWGVEITGDTLYSAANAGNPTSDITVNVPANLTIADESVDVYGIKYIGTNSFYNANGNGSLTRPTGTISITNNNAKVANIYGMYSPDSDTDKYAFNAGSSVGNSSRGIIEITNTGDANVWGMSVAGKGSGGFGKGAQSEITIKNTGNGNVTGIQGLWHSVNNARGTMTIDNTGNGNITGLYGLRNGCGGGQGDIKITNTGAGNITGLFGHFNSCKRGTGTITIVSAGGKTGSIIYGLKMGDDKYTAESDPAPRAFSQLSNSYAAYAVDGYGTTTKKDSATGLVDITQNGTLSTVYGMYNDSANGMFNVLGDNNEGSNLGHTNVGADATISITRNAADGEIGPVAPLYGMYSENTAAPMANVWRYAEPASSWKKGYSLLGKINLINNAEGNVFGVYATGDYYNVYLEDELNLSEQTASDLQFGWSEAMDENISGPEASGKIIVENHGSGTAVGVYGKGNITTLKTWNDADTTTHYIESTIQVKAAGSGDAVGIFKTGSGILDHRKLNAPDRDDNTTNNITVNSADTAGEISGNLIGVYADGGVVNNGGMLKVGEDYANTTGNVIGIYATGDGTIVNNTGTVSVDNRSPNARNVIGIYAGAGVTVNNTGTILVAHECCSPDPRTVYGKAYGIYAESGATIKNNGIIQIQDKGNPSAATGTITADEKSDLDNAWYIALNQPKISVLNDLVGGAGRTISSAALGGATLMLGGSGKYDFGSATYQGAMGVDPSFVARGFADSYTNTNAITTADISKIDLWSGSAMFNASISKFQDGSADITMTRRGFDELTENGSLAAFLEHNYALGNNEAFYRDLKSIGTVGAFRSAMNDLGGMGSLPRFAHEDMTMLREMNLAMNTALFAGADKNTLETSGSVSAFSFKNNRGSNGQYALGNKRITPHVKVGYAMSVAHLSTKDKSLDNSRNNVVYQVAMPVNYRYGKVQMMMTPTVGFMRGHYNRSGMNAMTYSGTISRRVAGLMNEGRYPMLFGNTEIAPTIEMNALMLHQKGGEDNKAYALTIPSDRQMSVESGIGLNLTRTTETRNGRLSMTARIMGYHEFADPYRTRVGMRGMSGTFDLTDGAGRDWRAEAAMGFTYTAGSFSLYGQARHYWDQSPRSDLRSGLKWVF